MKRTVGCLGLVSLLISVLLLSPARPTFAITLLSDDFESYSAFPAGSWFNDSENGSWSSATDGTKVARQTSTTMETYIVTNGQATWSDYSYAARVKVGSTSVRNGIVARYQNSNNYYFLLLYNGNLLLNKKVSGSTTTLQSVAFSANTSTFYTLRLDVSGTSVKGYVDGVLLVQGSDSSLTAGKIGLYANGVASFDDVLVSDGSSSPTPTPTPTQAATATPTATPASTPGYSELTVTAISASGHDGNVPANTRDNDLGTRWSAEGDGQWIQYDLGASVTVGYLLIAWYQGDARQASFEIQLSADAASWTQVFSGQSSGSTLEQEVYDFADASARYVRIVGYGNTVNTWNSITEVDIFGLSDGTPAPTPTPAPAPSSTPTPTPGSGTGGRQINVSNSTQLANALADAIAGDSIILADGSYSIGKITSKHGTASSPIVIKAANRGGAIISSGQLEVLTSSYIVIEGLEWTTDMTIKLTSSNNIRLTRNHFHLTENGSLKWIIIQGADSHHNRIDHNLFEEKHQLGNFITIDGSSTQQSQYDLIDHNHFRNIGPRATNEMEAIRVGWSAISQSSGFTTLEYNLFENCDGDPEIVSVKSNDNIVRYNSFKTSQGVLSLRHGNRSSVYGNFFLGGGKAGTGGVRVYGQDHKIYNNYFEGLTGSGYDAPLQLDGGDVDTSGALSAHWRVYRAVVVNNTFVNNVYNIEIGRNYSLPPVDSVIANNIVKGSTNQLVAVFKEPVNMTWQGNIMYPTGSATLGVSKTEAEIRVVDPQLTTVSGLQKLSSSSPAIDSAAGSYPYVSDDMDGQARGSLKDVGADEYATSAVTRRPLIAGDVGVDAP